MPKENLTVKIAISSDKYIMSLPFFMKIILTNTGESPLFLYKYGLEIGLQLEIEGVDEKGNILLIPALKDIQPDLSKENFLELAPQKSYELTEDISLILESVSWEIDQDIYMRVSYSSKNYGKYAKDNYQINAFVGKVFSNQVRISISKSEDEKA